MEKIAIGVAIVIFIPYGCQCAFDPCQQGDYKVMKRAESRSTGYILRDNIACCDNRLENGWYRINSSAGEDMPSFCPPLYSCGTIYPIWMKGSVPQKDDIIHNRTVAVHYSSKCSFKEFPIQVKNCGAYRVYYLVELDICTSGYCFGSKSTNADTWCTPKVPTDTTTSTSTEHSRNPSTMMPWSTHTLQEVTPAGTTLALPVVWIVVISLLSVVLGIVAVILVLVLKKSRHPATNPAKIDPPPPYCGPPPKHGTAVWQIETSPASAPPMYSEP